MADSSNRSDKINLLILASSLRIGGAESVMRHLALSLDRSRFNVTVCYLKQRGQVGEELARAGIDVIGVLESDRTDYLTFRKLLRVVRDRQIDVIHTHTTHGLVDASLCRLFARGLKVVHTFHFGNYPHTRSRILWMERVFSRFAHRLLAVGEVQRRQLMSVYGFADSAIGMVWNGVTLPEGPGDQGFRASMGDDGTVLIGTIGTLIEQKGLFDLMHVARRLVDSGRKARFVIVGEGVLRPELERLRHQLELDDVVAMPGWVTNAADVVLPSVDVFFQPSLWEAMSVVVLEAMAAARPIVATRVGENAHVIEDGVDGLLVAPRDIDAMAGALGRLIDDAALRGRLGAAARSKAARQFTVEQMARAYEAIYLTS